LCKNFPVLEKIEDPLVILDKLKEIRRTLEDTLALSALYLKDAREFPFDDPEFSELQKEIIELQSSLLMLSTQYAHLAVASEYDDTYIILQQLVRSLKQLVPLEPKRTSWHNMQVLLTKLYFYVIVLINLPREVTLGGGELETEARASTDGPLDGPTDGSADGDGLSEKPAKSLATRIRNGNLTNIDEVIALSKAENDPEFWDDLHSLRFGHNGESLICYIARTRPLSQALQELYDITARNKSPGAGLHLQILHDIDDTEKGGVFHPRGSSVMHILARRYKKEQGVPLDEFLRGIKHLQELGANVHLHDGHKTTFADIFVPPSVNYPLVF
jgi:hypothetical protein